MNERCSWVFIGEEEHVKDVGVIGNYVKVDGKLEGVVVVGFRSKSVGLSLRCSRRRRFG